MIYNFVALTSDVWLYENKEHEIKIKSRREARFFAPVQTCPGAHPASHTMGTGSFSVVKRPGCGFYHPPHLALRLKQEWSYTSTPSLGLRGLF